MREGLFIIGRGVGQVMFQNNAVSFVDVSRDSLQLVAIGAFCPVG